MVAGPGLRAIHALWAPPPSTEFFALTLAAYSGVRSGADPLVRSIPVVLRSPERVSSGFSNTDILVVHMRVYEYAYVDEGASVYRSRWQRAPCSSHPLGDLSDCFS